MATPSLPTTCTSSSGCRTPGNRASMEWAWGIASDWPDAAGSSRARHRQQYHVAWGLHQHLRRLGRSRRARNRSRQSEPLPHA
jgi:hypothetical protein